ncbi:hypothetical protein ACLB2K_040224 [Fragaria x ananassa]
MSFQIPSAASQALIPNVMRRRSVITSSLAYGENIFCHMIPCCSSFPIDCLDNKATVLPLVVECYLSPLGVFFEPKYYIARRTLCKFIYMVAVIDDMYDVYGTLEELELFNEAIQRWDISAMDPLPDYMKVCYKTLLDVYTELEENLASEGSLYGIHHARESMKMHVGGYMKEDRWFNSNYTPTIDEYMPLAALTSLYSLAIVAAVGMGVGLQKTPWIGYSLTLAS